MGISINSTKKYITTSESGIVSISHLGVQGTQGTQGTQGVQGVQGFSAYEIAVHNGYIGTELDWVNLEATELAAKVDKSSIGNVDTNYVNIFLYNMMN